MSKERRQIFNEINITPLTDIFLVLLIIMMVIAPMLDSQGLKLAVPAIGSSKSTTEQPKALTVHITTQGQYLIDNQSVAADMLQEKLFHAKVQYPDGLILEVDPNSTHGAVVKAMDAARGAGIDKMAVSETSGS